MFDVNKLYQMQLVLVQLEANSNFLVVIPINMMQIKQNENVKT